MSGTSRPRPACTGCKFLYTPFLTIAALDGCPVHGPDAAPVADRLADEDDATAAERARTVDAAYRLTPGPIPRRLHRPNEWDQ